MPFSERERCPAQTYLVAIDGMLSARDGDAAGLSTSGNHDVLGLHNVRTACQAVQHATVRGLIFIVILCIFIVIYYAYLLLYLMQGNITVTLMTN
jgi:hypothetical protein